MEYRQLGDSDIKVSAITFGAWAIGGWMWGEQDETEAIAAMETAIDLGVTTIDTAAVYGFGKSERLVAKVIKSRRDRIQVLTKFGLRWDRPEGVLRFDTEDRHGRKLQVMRNSRPDSVIEECERSLKRLDTDVIDLFQCHWPDLNTPIEDTMEAIETLIQQGKIRAAGVSNYNIEQLQTALSTGPLAACQPPYSMVNRAAEDDLIPFCSQHNIGVIVYSPLQRGLLTGKITEHYEFKEGDHRAGNAFFKPQNVRKANAFLDKIRPIAQAHNATLAQLVINWTIHRPGITAALVGARNPKQAEENAKAFDLNLTKDETSQINTLLEEVKLTI